MTNSKLPRALRHKNTGAIDYINEYGTYRAKGLNGSAYDYDEHYKGGYRPINITFHDFVVGVTFDSKSPNDLKAEGLINDLDMYRKEYNTGYDIPNVPWSTNIIDKKKKTLSRKTKAIIGWSIMTVSFVISFIACKN